jgi:hypothetical protein
MPTYPMAPLKKPLGTLRELNAVPKDVGAMDR